MSRADKKARQRSKREAKRRQQRRQNAVSPVKRLANALGEVEVWLSEDFQEFGQAQCFVFRRGAGLSGMACFLVDRGVAGLKDAWVRMNVTHDDLDAAVQGSRDQGIPMRRGSTDEVRRLVAGGLRWAHEHGLRHPAGWQRTAQFIGGVEGWQDADTTGFVKEFAGHPEDLRQRLIGEPLEQFLNRSDIDFDLDESAIYMDQATGDYLDPEFDNDEELSDEELDEIASELPEKEIAELERRFDAAAGWLSEQTAARLESIGEQPSPKLREAWRMLVVSRLLSKTAIPEESDAHAQLAADLLSDMIARFDPPHRDEVQRAVDQAFQHLETDSMLMQTAVQLQGDGTP
jgi:hypothetical protein